MEESVNQIPDNAFLIDGNLVSVFDPGTSKELQEELMTEKSSVPELMQLECQNGARMAQSGTSSMSDTADNIDTIDKLSLGLHMCDICKKEFATSTTLNRHLRNIHKEVTYSGIINKVSCALCDYRCERHSTYCCHLEQNHGVNIEYEYLIFKTEAKFFAWKTEVEKASKASFTKKCNKKSCNGWETQYFYCHRSGYINTKKPRHRAMKAQGSCKMNKTCPAKISVITYSEFGNQSFVEVEYVKTHVGHGMDLSHIRLNAKDKLNIALKLLQGTSFDQLLDSIHDSLGGSVERIHLLTRKDIHNIASQFNIYNAKKNDQTMLDVDQWVKEIIEEESHNPVLLYKPLGSTNSDYPLLQKDDFVLGIMTSVQMHMLQIYGGDIVILESLGNAASSDFPLMSLLVFDELRQAFPVAFLLSNNQNESTLISFLEAIRNQAGLIKPQIFMSAICESFHNAWQSTMGEVNNLLFCTWDVCKDWKSNLCLIENKELKDEVYNSLMILLEETDEVAFRRALSEFVSIWLNCTTTKQFGEYFLHVYCSTVSNWAYCYRRGCNINKRHLEDHHKILNDICGNDNTGNHLIIIIHKLIDYIQTSEDNHFSSLHEEKVLEKLSIIRQNHIQSLKLNDREIKVSENDENTLYFVPNASGEISEVRIVNNMQCSCALVCIPCNICIHKYTCTCPDYSIHWNICYHIHLVCKKQLAEPYEKCGLVDCIKNNDEILSEMYRTEDNNNVTNINNENELKFSLERKKIKEIILRLLQRIDTCNSAAEMNVIKQLIAPLTPK